MKFKKIIAILLSLSLLLSFGACDKDNDKTDSTTEKTTSKTTTEDVADTIDTSNTDETQGTDESDKTDTETKPAPKPDKPDKPDDTDTSDGITPLLYKVTDAEGNVVWLFGSIHIGKDYFYPLPDYVMNAYNSSDALAVEFDTLAAEEDIGGMMSMMKAMLYSDRSKISSHIPEDLYNEAKSVLEENGMYVSAFDYYRPILWSTLIDNILYEEMGFDATLGIDYHFLNTAHKEKKPVYDIESMEFQMNMLTSFSDELQIMMLEESVNSYKAPDEYEKTMNELVDAWATGNEAEFNRINNTTEFSSAEEEKIYKEYQEEMISKRNIAMADYAEKALKSGEEVFIVVGAAHIIGDGAMAELLSERGYTVEVIK